MEPSALQVAVRNLNRWIGTEGLRPFARRTGISPGSAHAYANKGDATRWNLNDFVWALNQFNSTISIVPLKPKATKPKAAASRSTGGKPPASK